MKIIITESQLGNFFTKVANLPSKDKKKGILTKMRELLGSKDQFLGELILKGLNAGHGTITKKIDREDESGYLMNHIIYFSIDNIPFKIESLFGSLETDNMWYYILSSSMFGDEELKVSQSVLEQIFDFLWKIS
jgi:hypothetical protein